MNKMQLATILRASTTLSPFISVSIIYIKHASADTNPYRFISLIRLLGNSVRLKMYALYPLVKAIRKIRLMMESILSMYDLPLLNTATNIYSMKKLYGLLSFLEHFVRWESV